ncbi:MAG: hypothetical protein KC912_18895 [Proteobacteria bacterium]|nr:hypothetical protein [Pseudomonadota bacterium]
MSTTAVIAVRHGEEWTGVYVADRGGVAQTGAAILQALVHCEGEFDVFESRFIKRGSGPYQDFPGEKLQGSEIPSLITPRNLVKASPNWLYMIDARKRKIQAMVPRGGGFSKHEQLTIGPDGTTTPAAFGPYDQFADLEVVKGWPKCDVHWTGINVPRRVAITAKLAAAATAAGSSAEAWRALVTTVFSTHVGPGALCHPRTMGLGDLLLVKLDNGSLRYPFNSLGRRNAAGCELRGEDGGKRPVDLSWEALRAPLAEVLDIDAFELALASGMYPEQSFRRDGEGQLERQIKAEEDFTPYAFDTGWTEAAACAMLDWLRGFEVLEAHMLEDPFAELRAKAAAVSPAKLQELEAILEDLESKDATVRRNADTTLFRFKRRLR